MRVKSQYPNTVASQSTSGFTLLELIIVVALLGIVSAIAAPAWSGFVSRQSLNTAQDQVYRAMQEAKSNAKLQKLTWQFSIREQNRVVQLAVHPATINPANATWNNLDKRVRLDPETTLQKSGTIRRIQFDYHGNVRKPPLGRVTLSSKQGGKTKRCVVVSTIIGTLRTAKERRKQDSDKRFCY